MMRSLTKGCLAVCILFAACTKDKKETGIDAVNDADRTFAATAGRLYVSNMDMARVAFENSSDSLVLYLAEGTLNTSNSAYYDIIELGKQKAFSVPNTADDEHIALKNALSALSGHALDSTYIHLLVEDQHALLNAYDILDINGNNLTLKDHASRYSDTFLIYHELADSLADNVY